MSFTAPPTSSLKNSKTGPMPQTVNPTLSFTVVVLTLNSLIAGISASNFPLDKIKNIVYSGAAFIA
jgi:hypothetical protein